MRIPPPESVYKLLFICIAYDLLDRMKQSIYNLRMEKNVIELLSVWRNQVTREYFTPNPPHRHSQWELLIFEKGVTENIVNETIYTAQKGDVFLLGPHHLHEIRFVTTPHLHRDIYFSAEVVRKICNNYSADLFDKLQGDSRLLKFRMDSSMCESVNLLCHNLDTLCLVYSPKKNDFFHPVQGLTQSILNMVVGIYFSQHVIKKIEAPAMLLDILKNLQSPEYFTQKVSDIIALTNYSHSQFLKIFKQYTGIPIVQYLSRLRIKYAAELLRHTDNTILSICEESGYDSLSFFIKSFKLQYGQTPLQYRKTQRDEK